MKGPEPVLAEPPNPCVARSAESIDAFRGNASPFVRMPNTDVRQFQDELSFRH